MWRGFAFIFVQVKGVQVVVALVLKVVLGTLLPLLKVAECDLLFEKS